MRRRDSGFTILELVVALTIVMLVLFAATTFFITTVRQYKIQTKIVETNVEGILGLELLRKDLESLGFGLPWDNVASYNEAIETVPQMLNDEPNPPRAVVSLDNAFATGKTVNDSDYLVIKSARVGMGRAAGKWTTLQENGVTRRWGSTADDPEEDLQSGDRVIVLTPALNLRTLVTPAAGDLFSNVKNAATYAPADNLTVTNIVYGIDNTTTGLRFPFNRADYYIDNVQVPQRCAPNTGVLVKRVVSQADGNLGERLPLLDCVADMQVIYGLDINGDKAVEDWEDDISQSPFTADTIRTQLAEVRVHILAQEGQRDDSYTTPSDTITVGSENKGRDFSVSGYRNYRWKVYTIVVKPRSLGN